MPLGSSTATKNIKRSRVASKHVDLPTLLAHADSNQGLRKLTAEILQRQGTLTTCNSDQAMCHHFSHNFAAHLDVLNHSYCTLYDFHDYNEKYLPTKSTMAARRNTKHTILKNTSNVQKHMHQRITKSSHTSPTPRSEAS